MPGRPGDRAGGAVPHPCHGIVEEPHPEDPRGEDERRPDACCSPPATGGGSASEVVAGRSDAKRYADQLGDPERNRSSLLRAANGRAVATVTPQERP
jgi:hypothetical protein